MDLVCTKCQTAHSAGTKYCTQCGTNSLAPPPDDASDSRRRQPFVCPSCGQPVTPGAKFCGYCSQPVADVELRPLTILFCDIVESTALNQALGDETYNNEVLKKYRDICEKVVDQHKGTIAECLGDGIVAYFGYPEVHEDDPCNAVAAGWQIVQRTLREQSSSYPFQVRVGIHSGLAFISQGQAVGEAPALAFRVQDGAQPNTVLITESTQRHVTGFFELEEQTIRQLKGFSRSTRLYRVVRSTGARNKLEAKAIKGLSPFVAREAERDLLAECWEKTKAGFGQSVLLRGEPGIGKSRIINEFKKSLTTNSYRLVESFCSPHQKDSAFAPIAESLKNMMGIAAEESTRDKLAKLSTELTGVPSLSAVSQQLIAQVLSIPQEPLQVSFTPVRQRQLTLEALVAWLLAKSKNLPLLLIVEDLHWADPSTLELLSLIMSQQWGQRFMLLASYRSEFAHSWLTSERLCEVSLTRLDPEQATVLVNHVTNNCPLPPSVLQEVVSRTDGVPLFIEEMTKTILESGYLKLVSSGYELTGTLPSRVIPVTVQDSLMARLGRLGIEKKVAQIGATLGREFRYDVLQAVTKPVDDERVSLDGKEKVRAAPIYTGDLESDLARLIEADLISVKGESPWKIYAFKHALIQEAAYDSLVPSVRNKYHRRVAEVLESCFSDVAQTEPELLAQHFAAASANEKALEYWEKAGQRAVERAANREAIAHLEKALEILEKSPRTTTSEQRELGIRLKLMAAHMVVEGWASPKVETCCLQAQLLAGSLGDGLSTFAATWGLWTVHFLRGELDAALEIANGVLAMALGANNTALQVMGYHAAGFTRYFRGELLDATEHATAGIGLFHPKIEKVIVETIQFSSTMALRYFLSSILWFWGKPEESQKELERADSLVREMQDAHSAAAFMAFKLSSYLYLRDTARMKETAEQLQMMCEESGFELYVSVAKMYLGWAVAQEGDPSRGLELLESGLDEYLKTGSRIKAVEVQVMRAEVLQKARSFDLALVALEDGIAETKRQEHLLEPELYRIRGEIRYELGDDQAAVADFGRALDIAHSQGALSLELRAMVSKCRCMRSQAQADQARNGLAKVFDCFTEGFTTRDLIDAKSLLDDLRVVVTGQSSQ